MAIFHLKHGFLKRSSGASSIAKAAYNAGQKIEDSSGSAEFSDYTRKGGVLHHEVTLPAGSPRWANDRGELWRRLEVREDRSTRRADAILAHSFDIALPCELTLEQNIFLARDFVGEQFTRKGYAVDWAIHSPDLRGDSRNIHLHVLVPLRKIEGDTFSKKDRYNRSQLRQQIINWRKAWAGLVNRHLKRYGHSASIDERSLRAQGIARSPTRHRGPQPKASRAALNAIRPVQPQRPVVKSSRQVGPDGSVAVTMTILHSGLNGIGKRLGQTAEKTVAPIIAQPRKGWPPEAVAAWEAWGKRQPKRFFSIWPELAQGVSFGEGAQP